MLPPTEAYRTSSSLPPPPAGCTCQIATPDGCDGPGLSKTLNAARGTWYYAIIQGTETTPQEDSFVFTTTKGERG